MKQKVIRLLLLLLALSMLLSVFVACNNGAEEEKTNEESRDHEQGNEDENGWVYTAPNVNYGGDEFNIYTWSETNEWVLEINEQSSPIDSETFYHFCNVEDELGVTFNIAQQVSGGWGAHTDFISKVAMLSGADDIDLICQYSLASIYGVMEGLYTNLMDVDYINWDAPYWSDDLRATNTLNGKMFYCTGELSRSVLYNMFIMVFNYDLADKYGLGDLHEMVESGEWTIAKLRELTQNIHVDLNQSQLPDVGDFFGLVVEKNCIDPLQYGCNLPLVSTNDIGELEINRNLYTDYGVTVTEKLIDLLHTNPGAYVASNVYPAYEDAMKNGNAVFCVKDASYIINTLNPSGINYGILPMPKYTEEQNAYYNCLSMTYSMFAIPNVAEDYNKSAAVLESLAHDGYTNLTPYIFEVSLKSRYSKRPEDAEMFDILRNGIVYEPGRIFANINIFSIVRSSVAANQSLTVRYQEDRNKYAAAIIDINFAFS